jgi:hypothetical protein
MLEDAVRGKVVGSGSNQVNPALPLNQPPNSYPARVGSAGAVIAEPGWAVMAVIAVPPLVLKVMVTLAIDEDDDGVEEDELGVNDDAVEDEELDVIDDVEDELEVTDDVDEVEATEELVLKLEEPDTLELTEALTELELEDTIFVDEFEEKEVFDWFGLEDKSMLQLAKNKINTDK